MSKSHHMIYAHRNSYPARHTDATKLRAYLPACSLASYQPKSSTITDMPHWP